MTCPRHEGDGPPWCMDCHPEVYERYLAASTPPPTIHVTPQDQIVVIGPGEQTLEENFLRFHAENPHVYEVMVKLARRWKRRRPGSTCGIGMLFEVGRWHLNLMTEGEPMNLNNNYRAFYARMIMEREADLDGIFNIRRQRSEP